MRTALVTTLASTLLAAALVPAGLTGCASEGDEGDPEDGIFVDDGKEDDFLSLSAQEYLIEGTTSITLTGADAALTGAARDARVREPVGVEFQADELAQGRVHVRSVYVHGRGDRARLEPEGQEGAALGVSAQDDLGVR